MSCLLGCQLSSRFAAVASVTGSMTNSIYNQCNPSHPTPVLQIHGTMDPTVLYNGNFTSKPIEDVIQYWVNFNNCHATPTITNLPDLVSTDGSTVIHYEYSGGNNGSEVVHFKVINGGHDWPGAFGNQDINASIEIWRFFSKFNLYGPVSTSISSIEKDAFTLYPRISDAQIVIKSDREEPFDIYDLSGKHIVHGVLKNGENIISVQSFAKGTYILVTNHRKEKFFVQ
jgi:polyhydroxybutyrate depolymerase